MKATSQTDHRRPARAAAAWADVTRIPFRLLGFVLRVAAYPLRLLVRLLEWAEGVPQLRAQKKRMEERPPLSDDDLALAEGLGPEEARAWSVIRRGTANLCVLPQTAVYPDDDLDTLLALMRLDTWWIFDWTDVVYRAEEALGVRLGDDAVWERLEELCATRPSGQFRHFAAAVTTVLLGARPSPRPEGG